MTYCHNCKKHVDYTVRECTEDFELDGYRFSAVQRHAFCPLCGEELFPDEIADFSTEQVHEAFRVAKGSITIAQIRELLKKYDIGANPLSLLLGWGENTVDRQMRHSIPDRIHADRLKDLLYDPIAMYDLLYSGKDKISASAFRKALRAVYHCIENQTTIEDVPANKPVFYHKIEIILNASGCSLSNGTDLNPGNYVRTLKDDTTEMAFAS